MKANNPKNFINDNYFADRKKYCIAFYNRANRNGKKAILTKYGQERGKQLLDQVKQEYENLLPQVPYVGEIDILKRQMLLTVIFTAIYRVFEGQEKLDYIWELCNNFNKETLMSMPRFFRWLLKQSTFSKRWKNSLKELAEENRRKGLADQWDYVEGDGKTFDYGLNMTRCAKVEFLRKIDAEAFAPYVCLIDKNFAECCNYGLKRTMVIAEGAEHCDFRLSKNGPVAVASAVSR